jgi:hypothetical protein
MFVGYYRYPILNKYRTIIQYKSILKGQENTAILAMHCNNQVNISVIAYHSLMHSNHYDNVTDMPISVPRNISLETKWIPEYIGPNYLEFVIIQTPTKQIKTGAWYHVLDIPKHDIQV